MLLFMRLGSGLGKCSIRHGIIFVVRGCLVVKFAIYADELSLQKNPVCLTRNIKQVRFGNTIAIVDVSGKAKVSKVANVIIRSLEHDLDDGV